MRACKIKSYLLEQSRVVAPAKTERNYHVFYYLLAGADASERAKLGLLGSAAEYAYTKIETACPGIDDFTSWAEMKSKLTLVGFDQRACDTLFTCLSAVLNLGNCSFCQHSSDSQRQMVDPAKSRAAQVAEALKVRYSRYLRYSPRGPLP